MALTTMCARDVGTTAVLRARSAVREIGIIALLYVGYSAARTLADGRLGPALVRAADIAHLEQMLHVPGELELNRFLTMHGWLGLAADYWYASAHYVVTGLVLIWLFRRGQDVYVPARRALAVATIVALGFYLTIPTAPPRMLPGFTDVMALHSDIGWWGSDASAPKGLGGMTNELAAFPSMHAGWALWVALGIWSATRSKLLRGAGVAYALLTGIVVIATANHWIVDVVVGQLIVLAVWFGVTHHRRRTTTVPVASEDPLRETQAA
ncbi:PAP2 superfamily protein [Nocardioides terrae]|uniref:PAP2 superfamily protein n=1 Tax=Nocardioides terrae TaxID=574651 RepID=A0A1I1IDZ8_9ACTN|nr:phosphatase PAP2 family protein [Nocardioides terrae]SFC34355.1 PAP2 superfamily protein [Nocardioides terrae]